MFTELATLAVLYSEPVRLRGRARRFHRIERVVPAVKQEAPQLPSEPIIHMIKPIINPNLFTDRFGSWPTIKGDRLR